MILGPRTKGGGTMSNTALGLVARRIIGISRTIIKIMIIMIIIMIRTTVIIMTTLKNSNNDSDNSAGH